MFKLNALTFLEIMLAGFATPAWADEPVELTPLVDVRTRYETVDQAGLPYQADAATTRVRAGFMAVMGPWSFQTEGEATLDETTAFNNSTNNKLLYPAVNDPNNIELDRLQIQYAGIKGTLVTVGRQRIRLDDERFVGSSDWRQNEQIYDAIRIGAQPIKGLDIEAIYMWSDRTIYGFNGTGLKPQSIAGNNVFVNTSYITPLGKLIGFAYLVDEDQTLLYTKSSQTYGFRFVGNKALTNNVKFNYAGSFANQSDYHRNPNRYSADYYLADLSLDLSGPTVGLAYEVMGADKGIVALTSFQTPYASLNRFSGWADLFLATPPAGLRDAYGTLGYDWTQLGPFQKVSALAMYHNFDSDRQITHYGNEWDLQISGNLGRFGALARYATYHADTFGTNVKKFALQLSWSFGPGA